MIETLINLTICKLELYVEQGILNEIDTKLNSTQSNRFFAQYLKNCENKSEEMHPLLEKLLSVTEVVLDWPKNMTNETALAIRRMNNIEKFEMWQMSHWSICHIDDGKLRDDYLVNLSDVIKKFLNYRSQDALKHLHVSSYEIEFVPGYMDDLTSILPNLKSLSLDSCPLYKKEFRMLCEYFQDIKVLNVSSSIVRKLNGIDKLTELEILNMNQAEFIQSAHMKQLFQLKKLKVLEIAGDPDKDLQSSTLENYLGCEKVLPELRFLDCSYNNITEDMLIKLIDTHKSLQVISLIGTSLESRSQFEMGHRKVKLLTINNTIECMDSMEHYLKEKIPRIDYYENILAKLCSCLSTKYEKLPEVEVHRCFDLMLNTFEKTPDDDDVRLLAVTALGHLCRDQRSQLFSYEQKQRLIRTVLVKIPVFSETRERNFKMNKEIFMILGNDAFLNNSMDNYEMLSRHAKKLFTESHSNPEPLVSGVKIMKKCFEVLPHEKSIIWIANSCKIKRALFEYLTHSQGDRLLTKHLLDFLLTLYQNRIKGKCTKLPYEGADLDDDIACCKMARVLNAHHADYYNAMNILKFATDVLPHISDDSLKVLLRKENLTPFEHKMTSGSYPEQWFAYTVIVHIYCREKYRKLPPPQFQSYFVDPMVAQIMHIAKDFDIPWTRSSPFLIVFKHLLEASTDNITVLNFVKWVLERHCMLDESGNFIEYVELSMSIHELLRGYREYFGLC